MSDKEALEPTGEGGKHGLARRLVEKALRAQADGDDRQADLLFAEAERTDPEVVANVLAEREAIPTPSPKEKDA